MLRLSVVLLFFILLTGCRRDKNGEYRVVDGIYVNDQTYGLRAVQMLKQSVPCTYLPVYYIGIYKDSVTLPPFPVSYYSRGTEDFSYIKRFCCPDSNKLKITVDTSLQTFYTKPVFWRYTDRFHLFDTIESYEAYYISIRNQCDSFIDMGSHNALGYTTIEAVDSAGNWVKAINKIEYQCGTAKRQLVMKPNDIIIAKYPKRTGSFYTRLRLAYKPKWHGAPTVFSNEFWGNIDFQREDE